LFPQHGALKFVLGVGQSSIQEDSIYI